MLLLLCNNFYNKCQHIKVDRYMELGDKFKILTEGAKYDVSCSSSGSNTGSVKGSLGNAAACGICHSFTSDGRCISLLKVLLSNHCIYD